MPRDWLTRVRVLEAAVDKQSARQISPADFTELGEKVYDLNRRLGRLEGATK